MTKKEKRKEFEDLNNFVKVFDGMGKPAFDFQLMYELFPRFEFEPFGEFGEYVNFGKAFEHKIYTMVITGQNGKMMLYYREYYDTRENSIYLTDF